MEGKEKIFFWLLLFAIAFTTFSFLTPVSFAALSNLGEQCKYSGECREGSCLNSVCSFPSNMEKFAVGDDCYYTAECKKGFCKEGKCTYLLRDEYSFFSIGIKSGCAGLIENCVGAFCDICNLCWALLIAGAAFVAFLGRKRGVVLMLVLFCLPVLVGIIIFPVLGVILALIELAVLYIDRKKITRFFNKFR
jgi:hypothetical protein